MFLLSFQVVPGQKPTEDALSVIASHGILGALCVILIVALFITVRALFKEKDSRFTDQKTMSDTLKGLNDAARDLAIEMNQSASELTVEANRAQDSVKLALERQERSLKDVEEALQDLQREQMRLGISITPRSR